MQPNSPYGPGQNQPQPTAQAPQPAYPPQTVQPAHQTGDYDFIMNPQAGRRSPFKLPGGNSMIGRIALVVVGLIVLLMLFTVAKSVFNRKPDLTPFVGIMQDQQAIIHIAINASTQTDITEANKNLALTTKLAVNTDQKKVYNYLAGNGVAFKEKTFPILLNARVDANADNQLGAAISDNTYDSVFKTTLQQKLNGYMQDLKHVYDTNKGPVGRTILKDNYDNAEKLLGQLNQTAIN